MKKRGILVCATGLILTVLFTSRSCSIEKDKTLNNKVKMNPTKKNKE